MAGTGKTFPTIEEWKAPWEKNGTEFDAETAKKLIYNMERNAHTAAEEHRTKVEGLQTQLTEAETKATEATNKVHELEDAQIKDAAERANKQLERKIEQLTELVTKGAQTQRESGTGEKPDLETAKLRAALKHGLSEDDAKRLVGATEDEILADAEAYAKRLGGGDRDEFVDDDDLFGRRGDQSRYDDDSDNGEMPRGVPSRQGFRTNLSGNSGGGGRLNPEKERELLPRR